MKYHYRIVNVFTRDGAILSGNPLCVFEDARGLNQAQMQALAQQLNLSETTFVLPSGNKADATVRIFTPAFEMPFAGHPTLGTAHVVADLQGKQSLTFDMHAGLIEVAATGSGINEGLSHPPFGGEATEFTPALVARAGPNAAPGSRQWRLKTAGQRATRAPEYSDAQYAEMLQLPIDQVAGVSGPILWVNTGSDQLIIPLATAAAVAAARPIPELLMQRGKTAARAEPIAYVWSNLTAAPSIGPRRIVARLFFGVHGAVVEDPATGSACANLGGWLLAQGHHGPLQATVSQGDTISRPSTLHLEIDQHDSIFVSGEVIELGRGWFEL